MLIPITCTCGRSLGDIYDAFNAKRKKIIEETLRKNGINVAYDKLQDVSGDDIFPELGKILDDYNIKLTCCRRVLLSSVDFYELMNKIYLSGVPQD